MTITLLALRTGARQRADQENSLLVSDTELNAYINSVVAELHDLMISAYDSDYNIQNVTLTTTNGTNTYALPDGTLYSNAPAFYKLRGIDMQNGSRWITMKPFNFNERNRNADLSLGLVGGPNLRYKLVGSNVMFTPTPNGTYTIRLWYHPLATQLALDADVLNDLNQYSEFVMVGAAIKMLQKEESDVSVLLAQKEQLEKRIREMAQNRDVGASEAVSDIYAENEDLNYFVE